MSNSEKIRLLNTTPDVVLQDDEQEFCIVTIRRGINPEKAVEPKRKGPHVHRPEGYMIRGGDEQTNWKGVMKDFLQCDERIVNRYLWELERFGAINLILDCKTVNKLKERGIKANVTHGITVTSDDETNKQTDNYPDLDQDRGIARQPITDPPPPPPKKNENKVEDNIQDSIQLLLESGDYIKARQLIDFLSELKPGRGRKGL